MVQDRRAIDKGKIHQTQMIAAIAAAVLWL
jgi:hypothetical protein